VTFPQATWVRRPERNPALVVGYFTSLRGVSDGGRTISRSTSRDHNERRRVAPGRGWGPGSGTDSAIPWARVEITLAASFAGMRKVPVQMSPCHSEMTMVESTGWVEIPILRTGLRVSENHTLSPYRCPSTSTQGLSHRGPASASGFPQLQVQAAEVLPAARHRATGPPCLAPTRTIEAPWITSWPWTDSGSRRRAREPSTPFRSPSRLRGSRWRA
jgi:hypothetical protein